MADDKRETMIHTHDFRRLSAAALVAASLVTASSAARAEDPAAAVKGDPDDPVNKAWASEPTTRRGGFTAGLSLGLGLGWAAGFPNDVKKIGFASDYTETGAMLGGGGELWLGGALTDWFNFGFGLGSSNFTTSTTKTAAVTFTFRAEAFPLFSLGGPMRDLGVMFQGGAGNSTTTPSDDDKTKLIDGGAASRIGASVFYEGVRFWKFGMGPSLGFDYIWSETVRQPAVFLAWRSAIYTRP